MLWSMRCEEAKFQHIIQYIDPSSHFIKISVLVHIIVGHYLHVNSEFFCTSSQVSPLSHWFKFK